jgi:hypothetical protein
LKKAAQKLLAMLGCGRWRRQRPWLRSKKSFFASFCSQKEAFLLQLSAADRIASA